MELSSDVRRGALVEVKHHVKEGKRERIVAFKGHVLKLRGEGVNKSITIRQTIDKVEVDRIFPLSSINLVSIVAVKETKTQSKRARQALAAK